MAFSFIRSPFNFYGSSSNSEGNRANEEEEFEKVNVPDKATQTEAEIKQHKETEKKVDAVNVTILLQEISELRQKIQSQDQKMTRLHQKLDLKEANLMAQDKTIAFLQNEILEQKKEFHRKGVELERLRLQKFDDHASLEKFLVELDGNSDQTVLMFGRDQKEAMEAEIKGLNQEIADLEAALKIARNPKGPGEAREAIQIENAVLRLQISEKYDEIKCLKREIEKREVEDWNSKNKTSKFKFLDKYIDAKITRDQVNMILEESEIQKARDASRHQELEERIRMLEKELEAAKISVF